MSELPLILCVLGFFAAGAIAKPESAGPLEIVTDRPAVDILPDIVRKVQDAIMKRSYEIIQIVLKLPSLGSEGALPISNVKEFRFETLENFISWFNRGVEQRHLSASSKPKVEECRKNITEFEKKLRTVAQSTYRTAILNIMKLSRKKNKKLADLNVLAAKALEPSGETKDKIATAAWKMQKEFLDYADRIANFYESVAEGSAIGNKFRKTYNAELWNSISNMIYHCTEYSPRDSNACLSCGHTEG
ncbi:uncharacterized protein [Venturia canescens]|uniref:uncharacterized protein n=1 Tax=Venturia canescens TaxID=32260 RepID=UPI001C9C8ABF|nr:uncharacterized protein LOC122414426 [Venturia canescens]